MKIVHGGKLPPWLHPCFIGGAVSVLAACCFWDYVDRPTDHEDLCIDVEEGISDLEIAGLALLGGLFTLYGSLKGALPFDVDED